jgi:GT2 family glycosyltransferase
MAAKRQGLSFESTALLIYSEQNGLAKDSNDSSLDGVESIARDFQERKCNEWSDGFANSLFDTEPSCSPNEDTNATLGVTHDSAPTNDGIGSAGDDSPFVSVCLVHHDRPHLLKHAIDSLIAQDFGDFEVLLVDDGSVDPASHALLESLSQAFHSRAWRIIRQTNQYLGAARNNAARISKAKYLLFMDDDNIARPDEISTLVSVAERCAADVVTCTPKTFTGTSGLPEETDNLPIWVPFGPDLAVGLLVNGFGDANALVKRSTFAALGGFSEDRGVGHEDWEFFARIALSGFRIELVPEPLFYYRVAPDSMLRTTDSKRNLERNMRPYADHYPEIAPALKLLPSLFAMSRRPKNAEG